MCVFLWGEWRGLASERVAFLAVSGAAGIQELLGRETAADYTEPTAGSEPGMLCLGSAAYRPAGRR